MRLTKLLGLLLPAVLLAACSGQQETVPIELNDLEFTLEGPFIFICSDFEVLLNILSPP